MTIHIDIEYVERIEEENKQLKEELLQSDYIKASVFSDREKYKKQIVELQEEKDRLKQELFNLYLKHYN